MIDVEENLGVENLVVMPTDWSQEKPMRFHVPCAVAPQEKSPSISMLALDSDLCISPWTHSMHHLQENQS
jgi:hypothetical protein